MRSNNVIINKKIRITIVYNVIIHCIHHCDLLIYNYITWRHISILTSEIRFPKFLFIIPVCWESVIWQRCTVEKQNKDFHVNQCLLFNSWFNPSGYKVFSFKTQKFLLSCKSVLASSAVDCFLICSSNVNSSYCWKLWFCSLTCSHAKIETFDLASLLWLLRRMLKRVSLFPTYWRWHIKHWSK